MCVCVYVCVHVCVLFKNALLKTMEYFFFMIFMCRFSSLLVFHI